MIDSNKNCSYFSFNTLKIINTRCKKINCNFFPEKNLLSKLVSFVLQHVPIYETHFEFDLIDYFDSKTPELNIKNMYDQSIGKETFLRDKTL